MKAVHAAIAGSLIVVATMVGVYAAAATAANTLAASFTTTETSAHARSVEFATSLDRASAERRTARADQHRGNKP